MYNQLVSNMHQQKQQQQQCSYSRLIESMVKSKLPFNQQNFNKMVEKQFENFDRDKDGVLNGSQIIEMIKTYDGKAPKSNQQQINRVLQEYKCQYPKKGILFVQFMLYFKSNIETIKVLYNEYVQLLELKLKQQEQQQRKTIQLIKKLGYPTQRLNPQPKRDQPQQSNQSDQQQQKQEQINNVILATNQNVSNYQPRPQVNEHQQKKVSQAYHQNNKSNMIHILNPSMIAPSQKKESSLNNNYVFPISNDQNSQDQNQQTDVQLN